MRIVYSIIQSIKNPRTLRNSSRSGESLSPSQSEAAFDWWIAPVSRLLGQLCISHCPLRSRLLPSPWRSRPLSHPSCPPDLTARATPSHNQKKKKRSDAPVSFLLGLSRVSSSTNAPPSSPHSILTSTLHQFHRFAPSPSTYPTLKKLKTSQHHHSATPTHPIPNPQKPTKPFLSSLSLTQTLNKRLGWKWSSCENPTKTSERTDREKRRWETGCEVALNWVLSWS